MQTQEFRREIPVRYDVDVFVAGGGPAGVTAAMAENLRKSRLFVMSYPRLSSRTSLKRCRKMLESRSVL